jgi:acyl-CoA dehydrogenase
MSTATSGTDTEVDAATAREENPIPRSPDVSFWGSSAALRAIVVSRLQTGDLEWASLRLERMGRYAGKEVRDLAAIADRESPRLVQWDERGDRIDRIDYHPSYRRMEEIAYGSGMVGLKYDRGTGRSQRTLQLTCFSMGYLFAMAEMGLYCPVCMTDGVARSLTRYGTGERAERAIAHLTSTNRSTVWTGGMFLTERCGGSDVGANETEARKQRDGSWGLWGRKWFCSNVDAQAVLVTARPEGGSPGTRGLRTWLILPREEPGMTIDRLKEKLGVRSMPTGEVTLAGIRAEEIGGFDVIVEMLNLSRLYNSVAAVAVMGRALLEAQAYARDRVAFGRPVAESPLAVEIIEDMRAEHLAHLLLVFEAVDLLGRADDGDAEAAKLLRVLTPMVKAVTGKAVVGFVSETMELIGGNAYIEDSHLPRLLRDAQVLPIWEGTTNILVLDTLRAVRKERGALEALLDRIGHHAPADARRVAVELETLQERDARGWVDRLTRLLQLALLGESGQSDTAERLARRPLGLVPGTRV